MAFVEAELDESCLLSALLAINLQPGETVQPSHFDDSGAKIPLPPLGVSTFWAIDDTNEFNGATRVRGQCMTDPCEFGNAELATAQGSAMDGHNTVDAPCTFGKSEWRGPHRRRRMLEACLGPLGHGRERENAPPTPSNVFGLA
jgi:hypothetical protein